MRKDEISRLLNRFLSMQGQGKEAYFDAEEIEDLLDSFEDAEDYTLYDEVLSLGMKLHPNHPGLQIKQCKLWIYHEQYKKALKVLESIFEAEGDPEADLLRLECLCALGRYAEVKTYTEELIESECDYLEDVFEYIVPVLGELSMHNEALGFIRMGQKYFPDNIILKEELCFNLEATGKIREAIDVCNELIDNNPYSFDDWSTLGRLYSFQSEFEKAIEAFDFALTCDENDAETKLLKAYCLFMNENYQKAIEVYNELTGLSEYADRVKPLLAECYLRLEDYETAYGLLRDVLQHDSDYREPASYINYLLCCAKTDRLNEEQEILDKALESFPDHINLLYLKALYYTEKGKNDDAIRTLRFILEKSDPEEMYINSLTDARFQLADLYYKQGDTGQALDYYLQVVEEAPDYPMAQLKTAICYLKLGDTRRFMEHISLCSDQEIIDFEGSYLPAYPEKNQPSLIDMIREYLGKKKDKPQKRKSE